MFKVNEIIKIPIDDICVNPANPRHEPVINIEESFIMQQLVRTRKDTQAMYKLICDIYDAGWFPQSIVTVTYNKKEKKYIAWDGNRRLTALKILQNPQILEYFKNFTYTQIIDIHEKHKNINDSDFYEVSCYVATSFEECADYIRTIHTTDTGALPWSDVAKKRFENQFGMKNTFTQLKEYCSKPFEKINENFSVDKFEKIVNSKVGKEYLQIENKDHILTHSPFVNIKELENKLSKIIEDIETGELKNENLKNATELKKYFYGENKKEESKNKKEDIKEKENKSEQLSIILSDSYEKIKKDNKSLFTRINIQKLNKKNPRSIGIEEACYQLQRMCFNHHEKIYTIGFASYLRILLEQGAIYFLINQNKWEKLKQKNGGRDLRLEQIIKELERNKVNYFDKNTLRCWELLNSNTTKQYFDMIMHHSELVRANHDAMNNIVDTGLFAIIQFFIDN